MMKNKLCHALFVRTLKDIETSSEESSDDPLPTKTATLENTEERRKLLTELSAFKISQLMELQCSREEVDREVSVTVISVSYSYQQLCRTQIKLYSNIFIQI